MEGEGEGGVKGRKGGESESGKSQARWGREGEDEIWGCHGQVEEDTAAAKATASAGQQPEQPLEHGGQARQATQQEEGAPAAPGGEAR